MITTSAAYQKHVQASHTKDFRADLEQDGVIVAQMEPIAGEVNIDRTAIHRRTVRATLAGFKALIPGGAGDLLAPGSALLRPYVGVKIPVINHVSRLDDTQAQWSEGTHVDTVATPDGRLTLG